MIKIPFSNLPDTTTPINDDNLNLLQDNVEDVFNGDVPMGDIKTTGMTFSGNIYNEGAPYYEGKIYWKEIDYGDQFAIQPNFYGADDNNKLKIMGAVGGYQETPSLYDLVTISGKSGNMDVKGNLTINGHLTNKAIPTSNNINDCVINATYSYDNGSNTYSNAPTTDGIHILNVYNDGSSDWVIQEDYVLRYSSSTVDKYIRLKTPTGWGNWTKIV